MTFLDGEQKDRFLGSIRLNAQLGFRRKKDDFRASQGSVGTKSVGQGRARVYCTCNL